MPLFQFVAARCAYARIHRFAALAVAAALTAVAATSAGAADPVPGALDTSFGAGNGRVSSLPIGSLGDVAKAIVVQSDGKIVLAGTCTVGASYDFCVARLNADGSLDAAFDGPSGVGNGKFLLPIGPDADDATVAALQPDGKIIVAGNCYDGVNTRFCAARLNPNGSLDSSFNGPAGNGAGKFLLPTIGSAGSDVPTAMILQPDGRIVLIGNCPNGSISFFCAMRLASDGSLDATFNGPSGNGAGKFQLPTIGTLRDYAQAATLQADGKIVIAGYCDGASNRDFCVARLNRSGTLDSSFIGPSGSAAGKFVQPVGSGSDEAASVLLQADGKIVVAGTCTASTGQFCAARFNDDGSLDTTFVGPAGNGAGKIVLVAAATSDSARDVAMQSDGKLILAGTCDNGGAIYFCFKRLNGDGTFDTTLDGPTSPALNGNGSILVSVSNFSDRLNGMVLQNDGKILAAGHCGNGSTTDDFCMVRLNGGPYAARQCSLDLDGDGSILATTDMLMATRVALGVRGTAVTAGVSFGATATRPTWAAIREYLIAHCGMSLP